MCRAWQVSGLAGAVAGGEDCSDQDREHQLHHELDTITVRVVLSTADGARDGSYGDGVAWDFFVHRLVHPHAYFEFAVLGNHTFRLGGGGHDVLDILLAKLDRNLLLPGYSPRPELITFDVVLSMARIVCQRFAGSPGRTFHVSAGREPDQPWVRRSLVPSRLTFSQ